MSLTGKILIRVIIYLMIFRIYFLFLEQRNLYYPNKEIENTPDKWAIGYEDINFPTPDGKSLNGWFIPADGATVTILYCHGNGGNISHRIHKILFFHEMGFNVFVFDYRGYGRSKGFPTEGGIYKDTLAAYDYLVSRDDVNRDKLVVYGKSLGGAIATELCTKREASALILESALASVEMRAKEMFPYLPMKLLTWQKYDALKKVKSITIPKLITHGQDDQVISFGHGLALFNNAAEPKKFIPFSGGHNEDVYTTSDEFKAELTKFLKDNRALGQ